MQQTKTYKLNKPEMDDIFSTAPLNENMDKVDGALAALTQRVVRLENCRIVAGWYQGSGTERIINLGERPIAVLVSFYASHTGYTGLAIGNTVCYGPGVKALKLVDNGFWVADIFNRGNDDGYCFVAFLGGWGTQNFPKPTT